VSVPFLVDVKNEVFREEINREIPKAIPTNIEEKRD
jgi:hypothetical protein